MRSVVVCLDISAYCAALFPIDIRQRRAWLASVSPSFRSGFVTVSTLMSPSVSSSFDCRADFSAIRRLTVCSVVLYFFSSIVFCSSAFKYLSRYLTTVIAAAMNSKQRIAIIA